MKKRKMKEERGKKKEKRRKKGETLITNRSVKSRRAKANCLICIIDTSCSIWHGEEEHSSKSTIRKKEKKRKRVRWMWRL